MLNKQLIRQLRSLQEIKKSEVSWRDNTRKQILNLAESKVQSEWSWRENFSFNWLSFRSHVPQPVYAVVTSLLLVLVVSAPVSTALAYSVPGDFFYPLKRLEERIALAVRQSPESQGVYYLKLAARRVNELKRLPIGDTSQGNLLRDYNISLSFAQANFEASSVSGFLAKTYDQTISRLESDLNNVVVPTQDNEVYQTARDLTHQVSSKALAALINLHPGQEDQTAVASRLSEEINKVEQKLASVQTKLSQLPAPKQRTTKVVLDVKRQVVGADEVKQEVDKTLAEAKELLDKKEFTLALQKVKEGEVITLKTEEAVLDANNSEQSGEVKGAEDTQEDVPVKYVNDSQITPELDINSQPTTQPTSN